MYLLIVYVHGVHNIFFNLSEALGFGELYEQRWGFSGVKKKTIHEAQRELLVVYQRTGTCYIRSLFRLNCFRTSTRDLSDIVMKLNYGAVR